ncbi:CYP2J2 [Branchiostoma lanceolatum]|uniref:CYP2J2 protein n=1 Tax=Branchiostoma lanceolatum TaxID=7740 RepID=A0A8J9YQN9_BRALA|nr:CYP2J2 [Branchiostoma lanceolatum]
MSFWSFPAFGSLQVILLAVLCVIATLVLCGRPRNLPPGPRGLPILGNVLSFFKGLPLTDVFADWSEKYGDVFTYYLGPKRRIALNGYGAIHEALVKNAENFSSRPPGFDILSPDEKALGIVQEPFGPKWKKQRKFTLMSLRDFGVGKRSMEGKILEEARALGDEICITDGRAFSITQMMQNAVANVICSIVFGCRYEYDDASFKDLLKSMNGILFGNILGYLAILYRPLRVLPGFRKSYQDVKKNQAKVVDHIKDKIREHEETFDPNDIRDFIDAFLLESKKVQGDENSTFNEQEHEAIVYQLFLAGTDTTSTTLRWALLYMILHPDIQGEVQQEIDSVLGPNLEPSMKHRSQVKEKFRR